MFLEGMCAHIPSEKMKQECKTFVDTYTAMILDLIAHGASPKDVSFVYSFRHTVHLKIIFYF